MGVRNLARAVVVSAVAVSLASSPAKAQLVTFSTSGAFSGGSCIPMLCDFGGYTLQWSGLSQMSWLPPADVLLGHFSATCYWDTCDGSELAPGSAFSLTISQNGPSQGTGTINGFLGWNGSTLTWTPDQSGVTIGGVTYGLTADGGGCPVANKDCIDISTSNLVGVTSLTDVHDDLTGDVTSTPEPATVALMATGIVGLIPFARRRRKA